MQGLRYKLSCILKGVVDCWRSPLDMGSSGVSPRSCSGSTCAPVISLAQVLIDPCWESHMRKASGVILHGLHQSHHSLEPNSPTPALSTMPNPPCPYIGLLWFAVPPTPARKLAPFQSAHLGHVLSQRALWPFHSSACWQDTQSTGAGSNKTGRYLMENNGNI